MKAAGVVLLVFAVLFFGTAVLCACFVPEAIRGEMREPEDVLGVFSWLAVSLLLGCSLLVAAGAALRSTPPRVALRRGAVAVLIALALLFAVLTTTEILFVEFGADWPLSLLIAAVSALGAGTLLLQERRAQPSAGKQAA